MAAGFKPIRVPFLFSLIALVLLTACSAGSGIGGSSGNGGGTPPPPATFTVGGTVSNLVGTGLVLRNSVPSQPSVDLSVNANGSFTFGTAIADGSSYQITVATQPAGQNCAVTQSSGIISHANATDVAVRCTSVTTYSIGGRIEFLGTNKNVVLQNNAADAVTVSANGRFTFATNQTGNTAYNVTVATQPAGQNCVVINGTGVVSAANVTDIVVSCPVPRFAYVANSNDNTISIYAVDAASGQLRVRGYTPTGAWPTSVAPHPSGQFLYAANRSANSVSAYAINTTTGALTNIGNQTSAGLLPDSVTVDPLGHYLYAIGSGGNTISIYPIHASTGTLGSPTSLPVPPGANALVFDPSGTHAFLLCTVSIGVTSYSILPYTIDPATGAMMQPASGTTLSGSGSVSLAIDPTGRHLYVANNALNNVSAYTIAAGSGTLNANGTALTAGNGPIAISVDPSGRYVYVANSASNDVSAFKIDATTGSLTRNGANVPTGTSPQSISIDASGSFAYVTHYASNSVTAYRINADGALAALTVAPKVATRRSPVAMALTRGTEPVTFVPRFAYAANYASNTVSAFTIDSGGALISLATSGIPDIGTEMNPYFVTSDPDGRFVYVANAGSGSVSGYAVNSSTGALTKIANATVTGSAPESIAMDPSGRFLYVVNAGSASNNVTVWAIDAQSGALSSRQTIAAGTGPQSIAVDPTGQWAFVAAANSSTVLTFGIDPTNGTLTNKASMTDSNGPVSLTVDPTGNFVYVSESSKITAYAINPANGSLTAQGSVSGGASLPLIGTADPTGKFFYQASTGGVGFDTINVLNGTLTPQTPVVVTGATSVFAEPSGQYAYVTGSNGVTGFTINAGGTLRQIGSGAFAAGNSPYSVTVTGIWQ